MTRFSEGGCHELWLEEPKVNIAYTAQKDQLRTARRIKITWLLKDHSWWLFPTNQVWVSTWYMGWCVWTNRNSERWCHSRTWVLYSCPSTLASTLTLIGLGPLQSLGNLFKTQLMRVTTWVGAAKAISSSNLCGGLLTMVDEYGGVPVTL